jgi:hypothetical protein
MFLIDKRNAVDIGEAEMYGIWTGYMGLTSGGHVFKLVI